MRRGKHSRGRSDGVRGGLADLRSALLRARRQFCARWGQGVSNAAGTTLWYWQPDARPNLQRIYAGFFSATHRRFIGTQPRSEIGTEILLSKNPSKFFTKPGP
jgi:hypothetical protein